MCAAWVDISHRNSAPSDMVTLICIILWARKGFFRPNMLTVSLPLGCSCYYCYWQLAFHRRKILIQTFKSAGLSNNTYVSCLHSWHFPEHLCTPPLKTHYKFHCKSVSTAGQIEVGPGKTICLRPIKSKLQLVANCRFNCNNYHPLVISSESTEGLTAEDMQNSQQADYIISNHHHPRPGQSVH